MLSDLSLPSDKVSFAEECARNLGTDEERIKCRTADPPLSPGREPVAWTLGKGFCGGNEWEL